MHRLGADGIESRLTKLFDDWSASQPGSRLFEDGPVDARQYAGEPVRVLYVLKEVNVTPTEAAWDLRKYVRDGGRAATWNNVVRWTQAALGKAAWDKVVTIDKQARKDVLRRVAVMNLNKRGGEACTAYQRLRQAVLRDRAWLRAEVDILDPDLVICGGAITADLAGEEIFDVKADAWKEVGAGVWVACSPGGTDLVSMPHPQARRAACEMFDGLVAGLAVLERLTAGPRAFLALAGKAG